MAFFLPDMIFQNCDIWIVILCFLVLHLHTDTAVIQLQFLHRRNRIIKGFESLN